MNFLRSMIHLTLICINPLLGIVSGSYLLIKNKSVLYLLFAFINIFALIQISQQATGLHHTDIVNYYKLFLYYGGNGILDIKHFVLSFIFNVFYQFGDRGFPLLIYSTVMVYYLSIIYICHESFNFKKENLLKLSLILFFLIFGVINFIQVTELVKQNFSFLLIIISYFKFIQAKKKMALVLLLMGLSLHIMGLIFFISILFTQNRKSLILLLIVAAIFSLIDHNKLYLDLLCKTDMSFLGCSKVIHYYKLNWKISLKEHCSVFLISFLPYLFYLYQNIRNLRKIDLLIIAYLALLIFSASTPHTFIRLINSGWPIYSLCLLSFMSWDKSKKGVFSFVIGLLFIGYNGASLYKRMTRATYQTSYLKGDITRLFKNSTMDYFKSKYEHPDARKDKSPLKYY